MLDLVIPYPLLLWQRLRIWRLRRSWMQLLDMADTYSLLLLR
jgi:hypothetical protein